MLEIVTELLSLAVVQRLLSTLVALLVAFGVNRLLRDLLQERVSDGSHVHTLRMLLRNTIWILTIVVILAVWLGFGSSFTVAMGILGAGIAFASQEVIGSLAGYLNIVTGTLYRIGDRIWIGDVVGDVLDISPMRTTLMEVGAWVKADQYTGRIVTVANRMVFAEPVVNFTRYWNYIWDEITVPVTYESDWQLATEIMLDHGEEYTADLQAQAETDLADMLKRYPVLRPMPVTPSLYTTMTDNWIELTLRYVVDAHERRPVKDKLHRDLLQHIQEEAEITVASTTIEIVDVPPFTMRGPTT
jgi:small-conductance mechanosensitive channel